MNRPQTCTNLIKAINRIAGPERDALRLSRALANVIIAQMYLVDLQLVCGHSEVDLSATKSTCIRLFDYRRRQQWPPSVIKGDGWDSLYEDARRGLDVLPTCDEAVKWANELIASIAKA